MVLLSSTKKCSFQNSAEEYYPSPTVLDKTHHHWHMVLAPYVQLGIPNACPVRRARKLSCWLPQEHTELNVYAVYCTSPPGSYSSTASWPQRLGTSHCWCMAISTVGKGGVCLHVKCCKVHSSGKSQLFPENKPSKERAVPVSSGQFGELIDTCTETIKRRKETCKLFKT